MAEVFEALKKYQEEHPEIAETLKISEGAQRIVDETEKILQAAQPQPQIYISDHTEMVCFPPNAEQAALQNLKVFEEQYPGIVRLSHRMDEYQHLKAELVMAKLKISNNTSTDRESEVE